MFGDIVRDGDHSLTPILKLIDFEFSAYSATSTEYVLFSFSTHYSKDTNTASESQILEPQTIYFTSER